MRLALWVAALLSVGGSFGLHPEPGDAALLTAPVVAADATEQVDRILPPRHTCVACLSQRPQSIAPLAAAPTDRADVMAFAPPPAPLFAPRLDTENHEGRAPPTAS